MGRVEWGEVMQSSLAGPHTSRSIEACVFPQKPAGTDKKFCINDGHPVVRYGLLLATSVDVTRRVMGTDREAAVVLMRVGVGRRQG